MKLKTTIITLLTMYLCRAMVMAQPGTAPTLDSTRQLALSGSIDTYFHQSFKTVEQAPRTSFANLPGFSLGMINLVIDYSERKAGVVADLVFGPRGSDAIFNAPLHRNSQGGGSAHLINQMYVYYKVSRNLRLNAGQFNTFLGYESISPVKNVHYSTSYIFSFGPFNHTGVWADINLQRGWTAKVALMNPTDFTEYNPFGTYTVGGQLSFIHNGRTVTLNATYGDPDGHLQARDSVGARSLGKALQLDFTSSFHVGGKYSVAISSTMRNIGAGQVKINMNDKMPLEKSGYCGFALYQRLTISRESCMALRTEYFSEFNKGVGALGMYNNAQAASVMAFTLSGNLCNSNFRFIPEVRLDKTSTGCFRNSATGKATTQMFSVNAAVVYTIPALLHKFKS
jgi:hypothetical protein